MGSFLIAVDSVVNVLLGLLLLIFPPSLVQWLGLPLPSSTFYVRILGAVILGIGLALAIEFRREPSSSFVGLGTGGAVAYQPLRWRRPGGLPRLRRPFPSMKERSFFAFWLRSSSAWAWSSSSRTCPVVGSRVEGTHESRAGATGAAVSTEVTCAELGTEAKRTPIRAVADARLQLVPRNSVLIVVPMGEERCFEGLACPLSRGLASLGCWRRVPWMP